MNPLQRQIESGPGKNQPQRQIEPGPGKYQPQRQIEPGPSENRLKRRPKFGPIKDLLKHLNKPYPGQDIGTLLIPEDAASGQTIIVTGSERGICVQACIHLLRLGVEKLIIAVRDLVKGENARQKLLRSTGREDSSIEVWLLDMDSYASVNDFASRAAALPRLDALLTNGDVNCDDTLMMPEDKESIMVRVVSKFLLCALLVPTMRESASKFNMVPHITIPTSIENDFDVISELISRREGGVFKSLSSQTASAMGWNMAHLNLLMLFGMRAFADRLSQSEAPSVILNSLDPRFPDTKEIEFIESLNGVVAVSSMTASFDRSSWALVHGVMADKESHGQYLENFQVHYLSHVVTGKEGALFQEAFFKELVVKLEKIAPGATSWI